MCGIALRSAAIVGFVSASMHEDIFAIDDCGSDIDSCLAMDRSLNFPSNTSTPTFSWNVTSILANNVVSPQYDVSVFIQETLPHPFDYRVVFGHDAGAACDTVKVPFGLGAPGSEGEGAIWPCPGCHLALQFPPCPEGWSAGSLTILGEFVMPFFLREILAVPNTTMNLTVASQEHRILALRSLHQPARSKKQKHLDISVQDLCEDQTCSFNERAFSVPVSSPVPAYSWSIKGTPVRDIDTPKYDVKVVFHENLPFPWPEISLGHSSGNACDGVTVPFGLTSKGDISPMPCHGCQISLQFPPCGQHWAKKDMVQIEGTFKMGFFFMGAPPLDPTPNITVNVSVQDVDGQVFDFLLMHKPSAKEDFVV